MAEAYGTVIIKTSDALTQKFVVTDDAVEWSTLKDLFVSAEIDTPEKEHPLLPFKVGEDFPHDGITLANGWLKIAIFGDEWMHAMEVLVKKGKAVEAYSQIAHEYGGTGLYALNAMGDRFFQEVGNAGSAGSDERDLLNRWLTFVPAELKLQFPDLFR